MIFFCFVALLSPTLFIPSSVHQHHTSVKNRYYSKHTSRVFFFFFTICSGHSDIVWSQVLIFAHIRQVLIFNFHITIISRYPALWYVYSIRNSVRETLPHGHKRPPKNVAYFGSCLGKWNAREVIFWSFCCYMVWILIYGMSHDQHMPCSC